MAPSVIACLLLAPKASPVGGASAGALVPAPCFFPPLLVVSTAGEAITPKFEAGTMSPVSLARDMPANASTASDGPALASTTASTTSARKQASVTRKNRVAEVTSHFLSTTLLIVQNLISVSNHGCWVFVDVTIDCMAGPFLFFHGGDHH